MYKIFAAATLAAVCSVAGLPAQAESFDMNAMTCQELLKGSDEDKGVILFWLDGYLAGVTGDTVVNTDNLNSFAENMGTACAKSPDAKVLDVSKIVGLE